MHKRLYLGIIRTEIKRRVGCEVGEDESRGVRLLRII